MKKIISSICFVLIALYCATAANAADTIVVKSPMDKYDSSYSGSKTR